MKLFIIFVIVVLVFALCFSQLADSSALETPKTLATEKGNTLAFKEPDTLASEEPNTPTPEQPDVSRREERNTTATELAGSSAIKQSDTPALEQDTVAPKQPDTSAPQQDTLGVHRFNRHVIGRVKCQCPEDLVFLVVKCVSCAEYMEITGDDCPACER